MLMMTAPVVSASYYRKATVEELDEEWDIEQDEQFQTISANNQNTLIVTFEDSGWFLNKRGVTFVVSEDELSYTSGWWIWKQTGTVEEIESDNDSLMDELYQEFHMWHVKLFDKYDVEFFYYVYNDTDFGDISLPDNVTVNYLMFGGGDSVVGCIYNAEESMVSVKDVGLLDMLKYGGGN